MNHIIWQFQSWVYNQRIESRPQKDICIPIFITALFATQVSISRTPTCGPSMQQNILQLKRKKKEILHYGTTWMNLEAIILSEINCHKKTNTARFHLPEVSKTVKFIESELNACFAGCEEE